MLRVLLIVTALVLGLAAVLIAGPHLPGGQRLVTRVIEAAAPVELEGFRLDWPFQPKARAVVVRDAQGPWLRIDELEVGWRPVELRHRRIVITQVQAGQVSVLRQPQSGAADQQGGTVPEIIVEQARLPVMIEPAVIGVPLAALVEGAYRPGRADVRVSLGPGRYGPVAWGATAIHAHIADGQRIEARLQGSMTEAPGGIAGLLSGDVLASRKGDRIDIAHLALALAGGTVRGNGYIRGDQLALLATANLPDLRHFQPLVGLDLGGQASISAQIGGSFAHPELRFSLNARSFEPGNPTIAAWLGRQPSAEGSVVWPTLAVRIVGEQAEATALGRVVPHLRLAWLAEAHRLSRPPLTGVQGSFEAQGVALGDLNNPDILGRGTIRLPQAIGTADFSVRQPASTPTGAVMATMTTGDLSAQGSARFDISDVIRLSALSLQGPGTRLAGDLVIDPAGPLAEGTLRGRVVNLAPWSRLAGVPLAGRASLSLELAQRQGQQVKLDLDARNLRLGDMRVPRVTATADLSHLFDGPRGMADLRAEGFEGPVGRVASAALSARGTAQGLDVRLEAAGERRREFRLTMAGIADVRRDRQALELRRLALRYGPQKLTLTEPAKLTRTGQTLSVERLALTTGRGQVTLDARMDSGRLDGRLLAEAVPLDVLQFAFPSYEPKGRLDGTAQFSGTRADPQVELRLAGSGLDLAGQGADMRATLEGRLRERRLALTMHAAGAQGLVVDAETRLPVDPARGFVGKQTAIDGRLNLSGDLARLTELLPITGQRFAGQLAADVAVGGTIGAPALTGRATVEQGRFENYDTGTVLTNVKLIAEAENSQRASVRTEGAGLNGGRFSGVGEIALGEAGTAYSLALELNELRVVDIDLGRGEATGTLRLSGLDDQARLDGAVELREVLVQLEQPLPPDVVKLDVTEINKPGRQNKGGVVRAKAAEPSAVIVDLGVDVRIPRAVVRGRGLDSDWKGQLQLGGSLDDPRVVGELTAMRGSFDMLGRSFALSEDSRVQFDGAPKIDPELRLTAESAAQDVTARLVVEGRGSKPSVRFESEPQLPPDEVLSRLIFGRTPGQLSAFQQIELARAAAGLATGGGAGLDPLARIQAVLGLDLLQAGSGTGGVGFSAGKYLDDRTMVRVEESAQGSDVVIERDLGRGVNVTTSAGQSRGGAVGLNWRRDY